MKHKIRKVFGIIQDPESYAATSDQEGANTTTNWNILQNTIIEVMKSNNSENKQLINSHNLYITKETCFFANR